MNMQNGVRRHFIASVLICFFVLVSSARAQDQQPQPPSPPPSDTPASKSARPQAGAEKNKPGETVGKSKLEKETGTVNDRIFEVLPNYGTVENAEDVPALYSWTKIPAGNRRGLRLGRLSLQRCFSLESRRQGMIQKPGDRAGTLTENVSALHSPITASAR